MARSHCRNFRFSFDLALPPEVAESIIAGSLILDDSHGAQITLYGKSYRAGGKSYAVSGSFHQNEDGVCHFNFSFLSEDYGRPPGEIKSVDRLFALAAVSAPETAVEVDFYATFEYSFADNWISIPPLPLPIDADDGWEYTGAVYFNSINSIGFSNIQDDGEIYEAMEIRVTDSGLYIQEMHLRRDKVIDGSLVQSLFREGSRLSSEFVARVDDLMDGLHED